MSSHSDHTAAAPTGLVDTPTEALVPVSLVERRQAEIAAKAEKELLELLDALKRGETPKHFNLAHGASGELDMYLLLLV